MSFFDRLFGKPETKALSLTDPGIEDLFGVLPTASGIAVSARTALRVPAVACAVGLISETTGNLPAKLFLRATKETKTDHPAHKLIHEEANEWTSGEELRTQLTLDALLTGNGYAHVVRLNDGTPFELHRLDPAKVRADQKDDGEPFYMVEMSGGTRRFVYQDILHISPFGETSPITLGREAIALAVAFEQHVANLFKNGGRPSGIIKSEKSLDVPAKQKIAASWFKTHGGSNSGGTAILDEGMGYDPLSLTLVDAQFAENRLEQIHEIARVFRVPPTLLFELSRGTWSNTEQMMRQFLTLTLSPWLKNWAWAYSRCLLTPEERKSLYIEFVTDDLLTIDHATRATAYGQYRAMNAMTGNEVRAGLNLPPHPDGDRLDNPHITTPDNSAPEDEAA
ncbi:phage portal protein [Nioella ostreopsis]|uniref:phage portal protein n=1 Tax=Nioella ostreopsis TaxID=2448479 RepID=UPI000FD79A63|nr:phage portal protein [Nioella ostreopsis]